MKNIESPPINRLESYDAIALRIAALLEGSNKYVSTSDLQLELRASYSVVRKRLDRLLLDGFITRKELPHVNAGMPPTYLYRATDQLTLNDLERALAQKKLSSSNHSIENFKSSNGKSQQLENETISVRQYINSRRDSSKEQLIEILEAIVEHKDLSINQLSELTGQRSSTQHSRIEAFHNDGILIREKRRNKKGVLEYFYSFSPKVTLEEVVSVTREYRLLIKESGLEVNLAESEESCMPDQYYPNPLELLLQKFPDFNPDWTEKLKEQWFESFQSLIEISNR